MSVNPAVRDHRAPVWVVEDNALYSETVGNLLRESAHLRCAGRFADGESAIAALGDSSQLPRMILMDIALPGMSGIECVRRMHVLKPTIPVIMLTVYESNDRIFDAICAGASGYLLKSASQDQIVEAIETVLAGGAAMDGQIARRVVEMFAKMSAPRADYGFSERERQILQQLVAGMTKHQIAAELGLSPHTIDGHIRKVYMKLHVNNRSGAVAKALKENLIRRTPPSSAG
jgi:DNA-binding NarL/FixJ family response regulator